ncbi:MAG TPA: hypothetical protein VD965_07585 [Burkholderiales bacterium]|nr:hypothetical protein [Burkholderiales bacterium]
MTADQPPQSPTAPVPADEFAARVEAAIDALLTASVELENPPAQGECSEPRGEVEHAAARAAYDKARAALRALALSGGAVGLRAIVERIAALPLPPMDFALNGAKIPWRLGEIVVDAKNALALSGPGEQGAQRADSERVAAARMGANIIALHGALAELRRCTERVEPFSPVWMQELKAARERAQRALIDSVAQSPAAQPAGEGQAARASDEEFDAAMERLVGASIDFGACTQDDAEGQALETLHQCRAAMRALWHRRPPAGDAAVSVLRELHDEIARLLAWWSRPGETPPSDYDQYRHKVSVGLEHALLAAKRALAARGQEQEAQEPGGAKGGA